MIDEFTLSISTAGLEFSMGLHWEGGGTGTLNCVMIPHCNVMQTRSAFEMYS